MEVGEAEKGRVIEIEKEINEMETLKFISYVSLFLDTFLCGPTFQERGIFNFC